MSVQSEINRIKDNVADAYDAIAEISGSAPSAKTSDNLAKAIQDAILESWEANY